MIFWIFFFFNKFAWSREHVFPENQYSSTTAGIFTVKSPITKGIIKNIAFTALCFSGGRWAGGGEFLKRKNIDAMLTTGRMPQGSGSPKLGIHRQLAFEKEGSKSALRPIVSKDVRKMGAKYTERLVMGTVNDVLTPSSYFIFRVNV
eukprot:GCRY01002373.1.p1 GENE.GCRY01002373.1~~GCRY01002373.1.p1  ORF type:complete len:147 (-),score=18.27 GCRY01002373.1:654-1094(-)